MLASGTNQSFIHLQTTSVKAEAIWRLWLDVHSWNSWDQGLADATADAPLALGVKGVIVPKVGAKAAFEVTEFAEGKSYAFQTGLILAQLNVRRIIISESPTMFRHEVSFSGPLALLWGMVLGPGFRRALPPTMEALAKLAECKEQKA